MPRVSREQTALNRVAITEASAQLFREHGIKGVSVSDLMAAAGLTHGGFYGHFASKDTLAAEACSAAFKHSIDKWSKRAANSDDARAARAMLVQAYLSAESRSSRGTSCPAAALAGDVAREPPGSPVGGAFAAGVEGLVGILTGLRAHGGSAHHREDALADFSTMVGALILSRATAGQQISDEFLVAARQRLVPSVNRARRRKAPPRRGRT